MSKPCGAGTELGPAATGAFHAMPLRIVAHRGATAHAPQNTLAAFRAALALGADAVELDERLTHDGIPVVYHYAYLDEATSGHGLVWEHTVADLRIVRVGGPDSQEHIPLLAEVLDLSEPVFAMHSPPSPSVCSPVTKELAPDGLV
jgi:glycerophosphoryl diester phosphodiesterase